MYHSCSVILSLHLRIRIQVYEAVPRLQSLNAAHVQPPDDYQSVHSALSSPVTARRPSQPTLPRRISSWFDQLIQPWVEYVRNQAFLASFSLSLLYFTVLSTGVQMQTYLLTLGFTSLEVSVMRLAAVAMELFATWAAPILMNKIGPIRSGLWFLNEQFTCIAVSVILYMSATAGTKAAGYSLIAGVTFSRLGLWGFDLSVQYLVQEVSSHTSHNTRHSKLIYVIGCTRRKPRQVFSGRNGAPECLRAYLIRDNNHLGLPRGVRVSSLGQCGCGGYLCVLLCCIREEEEGSLAACFEMHEEGKVRAASAD